MHQVMTFAQGWSLKHNVTLILSNMRGDGESGSGVWTKGQALSYDFEPGTREGKLKIVQVKNDVAATGGLRDVSLRRTPSGHQSGVLINPIISATNSTTSGWSFKRLRAKVVQVCSGSFCCTATALTGMVLQDNYAIGVLNGFDNNDGETWRSQVCVVLPCRNPGQICLTYAPLGSSNALKGVKLTASGLETGTVLVPEVVASGQSMEEILLPPLSAASSKNGSYTFQDMSAARAGSVMASATEGTALASVALYGRLFAGDRLPYSCP